METFLLIGITIVAAIWIIRKENKKLKNTSRLHRSNKTFSEECVKLLKYEKYGCYKLTGMQYKCLKQAELWSTSRICNSRRKQSIWQCRYNKEERQWEDYSLCGKWCKQATTWFLSFKTEGKVHALYYIWKYGKNRIYGCAYIRNRDEHR